VNFGLVVLVTSFTFSARELKVIQSVFHESGYSFLLVLLIASRARGLICKPLTDALFAKQFLTPSAFFWLYHDRSADRTAEVVVHLAFHKLLWEQRHLHFLRRRQPL
jgi:hypothetical protein